MEVGASAMDSRQMDPAKFEPCARTAAAFIAWLCDPRREEMRAIVELDFWASMKRMRPVHCMYVKMLLDPNRGAYDAQEFFDEVPWLTPQMIQHEINNISEDRREDFKALVIGYYKQAGNREKLQHFIDLKGEIPYADVELALGAGQAAIVRALCPCERV